MFNMCPIMFLKKKKCPIIIGFAFRIFQYSLLYSHFIVHMDRIVFWPRKIIFLENYATIFASVSHNDNHLNVTITTIFFY